MRHALASLIVVALAAQAGANGRPAGTSTLHFRAGHPSDIVAGLTFGLVISHDGGATWQWMCEAAVGYGGMYDPDYSYTSSGALFATTFNGLKVNRDGCNFDQTTLGTCSGSQCTFVSQDELAPDMSLIAAAADPTDAKIYKSTNDGMTFPSSASPGLPNDWWQSVIIPSNNASDVFVSGYRYVPACDQNSVTQFATCNPNNDNTDCGGCASPAGRCSNKVCDANSATPGAACNTSLDCDNCTHLNATCENQKILLFFKSVNGGTSYTAMPGNGEFVTTTAGVGLTTSSNSTVDLVGVSSDGATLYARVTYENPSVNSDGLYKIDTAAGTTWTHMLSLADSMSVLLRSNGDLIVATRTLGAQGQASGSSTWTQLTNPPHIGCLAEDPADHSVWACTQNFGSPGLLSDGYGIMKTSDFLTWTGVLRYQDIQQPVSCPAGTPQHDMCEQQIWCGLRMQLSIASTAIDCGDGLPDGGSGSHVKPPKHGCCSSTGGGAFTALLAGLAVAGTLLLRRRRPRLV
jgi:hypothetical protein